MYSYSGSKDCLLDAVLRDNVEAILDAAPLAADDFPGYAARSHGSYAERPGFLLLSAWLRLERVPAGGLLRCPLALFSEHDGSGVGFGV